MVKTCTCGNEIYYTDPDLELDCINCGSILYPDGKIVNIGLAEYRFKDINYDYKHVFSEEKELEDFINYIKENSSEYQYCTITTPKEIIALV